MNKIVLVILFIFTVNLSDAQRYFVGYPDSGTHLVTGDIILLNIIYLDADNGCLIDMHSMPQIKQIKILKEFMLKYDTLKFNIIFSTDTIGTSEYDLKVSQCRAYSLLELLKDDPDFSSKVIYTVTGIGKSEPLKAGNFISPVGNRERQILNRSLRLEVAK